MILFYIVRRFNNGPYSLLVQASYFISCSIQDQFSSVLSIDYKWSWGCRHFRTCRISMFCIEAIELIITNRCTIHFNVLLHWNLFVVLCEGWVLYTSLFAGKLPSCANDEGLTNLYGSVVIHIQHRLVLFLGPSKPQAGSFNR